MTVGESLSFQNDKHLSSLFVGVLMNIGCTLPLLFNIADGIDKVEGHNTKVSWLMKNPWSSAPIANMEKTSIVPSTHGCLT